MQQHVLESRYNNYLVECIKGCTECSDKKGRVAKSMKELKAEPKEVTFKEKKIFHVNSYGYFPKNMQERYPADHFHLFAIKGRAKIQNDVVQNQDEDVIDISSLLEEIAQPPEQEEEILANKSLLSQSRKIKKSKIHQSRVPKAKASKGKAPKAKATLRSKGFDAFFPTPNKTKKYRGLFPPGSNPMGAFKKLFDNDEKHETDVNGLKQEIRELKNEIQKMQKVQAETIENVDTLTQKMAQKNLETRERLKALEENNAGLKTSTTNSHATFAELPIYMRISKPSIKEEAINMTLGVTQGGGHA